MDHRGCSGLGADLCGVDAQLQSGWGNVLSRGKVSQPHLGTQKVKMWWSYSSGAGRCRDLGNFISGFKDGVLDRVGLLRSVYWYISQCLEAAWLSWGTVKGLIKSTGCAETCCSGCC